MQLLKTEVIIASRDNAFDLGIIDLVELAPFTCPDCHGALVRLVEGGIIPFRCHTGHAFTANTLQTLWKEYYGRECGVWKKLRFY